YEQLMRVLGLEAHLADKRFATYASRKANEDILLPLVEAAIRARDALDVEASLVAAGVPCARVNNFAEVLEDPQILARNVVLDIEHPRLGPMKTVRNPV